MTKEEIAKALEIPWPKIVDFAKSEDTLQELLSLAIAKGFQVGTLLTHEDFNKILKQHEDNYARVKVAAAANSKAG